MKRNLKHSILFVLTILVILSIVFISLAAAKPTGINSEIFSVPKNEINSSLGMVLYYSQASYVDTLLNNGFVDLRIDIPDYQNTSWLASSKAALPGIIAKGAKVVWGISSNSFNSTNYTMTAENWPAYRQAVLENALWAQNNGVYEFQLGNEAEYHQHYHCASGKLVRSNNVVTVTTPIAHGFDGNHQVTVYGATSDFDGTFSIIVTSPTTFTYVKAGANGSNNYLAEVTTMPRSMLYANLKDLATDIQTIFTRGKVSYSCAHSYISDWIATGKGSIDIIASNVYMGGSSTQDPFSDAYKTEITNLINAFGVDNTYLTEFNLSYLNINNYSTNEAVQAEAVNEMVTYINASGMKRAFWYAWKNNEFGVMKSDGTYRLLWNVLSSSGSGTASANISITPASKAFGSVDIARLPIRHRSLQ